MVKADLLNVLITPVCMDKADGLFNWGGELCNALILAALSLFTILVATGASDAKALLAAGLQAGIVFFGRLAWARHLIEQPKEAANI